MCNSCSGPTPNNCTSCNIDLILQAINSEQSRCISCEDEIGFKTIINDKTNRKSCREICGDGFNMGENECDDGNLLDGDGCSKDCKIEEGFICRGGNSTNKDACLDVKPPTLEINTRLSIENQFSFDFSEPLKILSTDDPKTFLQLTITGEYEEYNFDYEVGFLKGKSNIGSENNHVGRVLEGLQAIDYYSTLTVTFIPLSSIMDGDVTNIYIYIYYIYMDQYI